MSSCQLHHLQREPTIVKNKNVFHVFDCKKIEYIVVVDKNNLDTSLTPPNYSGPLHGKVVGAEIPDG